MARIKKLDMTNVESFSRCAEGIHTVKLIEFQEAVTQNGDDMLKATFEVLSGTDKGCRVFDNFTLIDKALWKFKQFLVAVGIKADGKVAIDLDKLINKVCDITVIHEEYNGVLRAKIQEYTRLSRQPKPEDMDEFADAEDDDEAEVEAKPVAKKAKPAPAPAPAVKAKKPAPKPEPEEEADEDEEWDDEEEKEEVPPPAKKGKPVEKAKAKKTDDDDWENA